MVSVDTYWANIFVGFKNMETGEVYDIAKARKVCSDYANSVGLCVTLTPTEYIYTSKEGELRGEAGVIVGLINYPRFPAVPSEIRHHASVLAKKLKEVYEQYRVTIMFPDETVMFGEDDGSCS